MINEFRDKYHFLSNYHASPIFYQGVNYNSGEAAFQAAKTLDLSERLYMSTLNPSEVKKYGRKVNLRKDWEQVKDSVMYDVCYAKFTQNEDLREKLLKTGDEMLIEGTTGWHDNYWGNCECDKCKDIVGKNMLGKTLMKVREAIKQESYLE